MPTIPKHRILMLSDRLSARGGADRHLLGLLEHLQGRAQTLLAVGVDDGSLPEAERPALGPWQRLKGLERSGLAQRGQKASYLRLSLVLKEFRPTVIHFHNIMDPGLLGLGASSGKALLTVQDHRLFCPGQGKLRPDGEICGQDLGSQCLTCFEDREYADKLLSLTRQRLRAAAGFGRVLVLSKYMAQELTRAWTALAVAPPPLEVLPPFVHGLDMGSGLQSGAYHLLAGRLVESKGIRTALRALELLLEPLPLVIAGDGPLVSEIRDRADASQGRLQYLGWADRSSMDRLLAGARSLWLPSLWAEPFGIVGLEAQAKGVPVIASDVGGVRDWLILGETGFLIPPGDAAALARAADRLAADAGLAQRLGEKGTQVVRERFSCPRLMQRLVDCYAEFPAGC
ncbi:MAG: glycosyltransferase family 4 protein [Desulfarculaceae bacterium]